MYFPERESLNVEKSPRLCSVRRNWEEVLDRAKTGQVLFRRDTEEGKKTKVNREFVVVVVYVISEKSPSEKYEKKASRIKRIFKGKTRNGDTKIKVRKKTTFMKMKEDRKFLELSMNK